MRVFFFFKQKTAYEMRISDWSSDVCSSDLPHCRTPPPSLVQTSSAARSACDRSGVNRERRGRSRDNPPGANRARVSAPASAPGRRSARRVRERSEEHTSELQSLIRISYAVFCFQKTKTTLHLLSSLTFQ